MSFKHGAREIRAWRAEVAALGFVLLVVGERETGLFQNETGCKLL